MFPRISGSEPNARRTGKTTQKEERTGRLHRNCIRRRDNGKQKEYEDRTKAAKKAEMDAKKNALRAEDIAKGVFVPVSAVPAAEPKKAKRTA